MLGLIALERTPTSKIENYMDSPFWTDSSLSAVIEVMPGRRSVFEKWADYCSVEMEKLFTWNSRSLKLLWPRQVGLGLEHHRAHLRGTHSLGSFATQPSPSTSSDNPSKPVCITVINCVSHVLWALSTHALS